MKKLNVIKFGILGVAGYLLVCGYHTGAAANGFDCTGAETGDGNKAGCDNGSCHATAATPAITVAIELDSAGVKTNYYVGGGKYTVKITGTNTGTTSQPDFGFQLACIKGTAAAATPTSEGTFTAATGTHISAPSSGNFVLSIVEQSNTIKATTGTGGNGSTYVESFSWTAPAKGTGSISFWGAINAVNDNGTNDKGDLWNTNHTAITEITSSPTGIASVENTNDTKVYPNPFSTATTFTLANEVSNASISLYDISGKEARQITFSGKEVTLERGTLAAGIYFYNVVSNNQSIKTGKLIVQ